MPKHATNQHFPMLGVKNVSPVCLPSYGDLVNAVVALGASVPDAAIRKEADRLVALYDRERPKRVPFADAIAVVDRPTRTSKAAANRRIIAYLLREHTTGTLQQIADWIGWASPQSVMNAVAWTEDRIDLYALSHDPFTSNLMRKLERQMLAALDGKSPEA